VMCHLRLSRDVLSSDLRHSMRHSGGHVANRQVAFRVFAEEN
jgi:hypothetical protein